MDRVVIMEARKKEPQQVLADGADGPLGRHVMSIGMIEAAKLLVGGEQIGDSLFPRFVHN